MVELSQRKRLRSGEPLCPSYAVRKLLNRVCGNANEEVVGELHSVLETLLRKGAQDAALRMTLLETAMERRYNIQLSKRSYDLLLGRMHGVDTLKKALRLPANAEDALWTHFESDVQTFVDEKVDELVDETVYRFVEICLEEH